MWPSTLFTPWWQIRISGPGLVAVLSYFAAIMNGIGVLPKVNYLLGNAPVRIIFLEAFPVFSKNLLLSFDFFNAGD